MYNSLEYLEKLAHDNNINIIYSDCSNKPLKSFIVKIDNQYFVSIDSNASMDEKIETITDIMSISPSWMPEIKLTADGFETMFYKKE